MAGDVSWRAAGPDWTVHRGGEGNLFLERAKCSRASPDWLVACEVFCECGCRRLNALVGSHDVIRLCGQADKVSALAANAWREEDNGRRKRG